MINLLPYNEKRRVLSSYRLRLGEVVAASLLVLTLVAGVLLIPTYAAIVFEAINLDRLGAIVEQHIALLGKNQELVHALALTNQQIHILKDTATDAPDASPFIFAVLADKTPGIQITSFLYGRRGEQGKTVTDVGKREEGYLTLGGVVAGRRELLAFVKRLEGDALFTKIESPFSNLIEGRDSRFTLSLTTR